MRLLTAILVALVLGGCATPHVPLTPVSFSGAVSVTSAKTAKVVLSSGAVRGSGSTTLMPAGSILIPVSSGPHPHLQFNVEDQKIFVDSFRSELQRLRIVRAANGEASGERADLNIQLIFAQTFHNPNMQQYTLDVAMEIVGGKKPFLRQYRVISSEGDSWWEKMNTDASEGKAKAGQKLMQRLIPDVAAYVAENP